MAYYLALFSPRTYDAFSSSPKETTGFRLRNRNAASKIVPGDRFICYMTSFSRWVGVLEATSTYYEDHSPQFLGEPNPFVIRFKVKPLAWRGKEHCIPIHEAQSWNQLSWTKGHPKNSGSWTGRFRSSLSRFPDEDGTLLEELIREQLQSRREYPLDEQRYRREIGQQIERADRSVVVTVPDDTEPDETSEDLDGVRDSTAIQAMLADIGEAMGLKVWIPRGDRKAVLDLWTPGEPETLLEKLPLNYDLTTLGTIERIDVLWLKGRAIVRAFEVEHTTAVYSGLLRMADLLALQPNMDIRLHIVAPSSRRSKVFQEIRRPVFSLLEREPLSEACTFLSYESVTELSQKELLKHLSPNVIEEYEEAAEEA